MHLSDLRASDLLGGLILWTYIAIALLGWVLTACSARSARYHPVVTLMASGMGVPVVGLATIRLARLLGHWPNANDIWAQLVLLVCFAYTAWTWTAALLLVLRESPPRRWWWWRMSWGTHEGGESHEADPGSQ